jgi:catalase
MAYNNQGNRRNFYSTQDQMQLPTRYYNDDNHTTWVGGAVKFLSQHTEIDYDQARGFVCILWVQEPYSF